MNHTQTPTYFTFQANIKTDAFEQSFPSPILFKRDSDKGSLREAVMTSLGESILMDKDTIFNMVTESFPMEDAFHKELLVKELVASLSGSLKDDYESRYERGEDLSFRHKDLVSKLFETFVAEATVSPRAENVADFEKALSEFLDSFDGTEKTSLVRDYRQEFTLNFDDYTSHLRQEEPYVYRVLNDAGFFDRLEHNVLKPTFTLHGEGWFSVNRSLLVVE